MIRGCERSSLPHAYTIQWQRYGAPDFTALRMLMKQADYRRCHVFLRGPYPGITTTGFSGEALVPLNTYVFRQRLTDEPYPVSRPMVSAPSSPRWRRRRLLDRNRRHRNATALVIGNSKHRSAAFLPNPDATPSLADALRQVGFQSVELGMLRALEKITPGRVAIAHHSPWDVADGRVVKAPDDWGENCAFIGGGIVKLTHRRRVLLVIVLTFS
jgi:hypothetical protein